MTRTETRLSNGRRSAIELPTVRMLSHRYRPDPRPLLILVTHVLPTAVAYVEALASAFDIVVVGIPYSVNRLAVRRLQASGYQVTVPTRLEEIAPRVIESARRSQARGQPSLLQEVGGYLADHAIELASIPSFCGVVEDTNNGHWRYEASDVVLRFPVVSIARSPIKALEDAQIGNAVAFSVERVLRHRLYRLLRGARVLVVGYGSIGSACATAFRERGSDTCVYDIDSLRLMRAAADGFRVGAVDRLARDVDVVVGATGHCSIDESTLALVRPGAVVASASSRQLEIDLPGLARRYQITRLAPELEQYRRGAKTFYVINNGFPVNFRDSSVVGRFLDAVYAELFACAREVAAGRARPGLQASWAALHREVARAWCRAYLTEGDTSPDGVASPGVMSVAARSDAVVMS